MPIRRFFTVGIDVLLFFLDFFMLVGFICYRNTNTCRNKQKYNYLSKNMLFLLGLFFCVSNGIIFYLICLCCFIKSCFFELFRVFFVFFSS